MCMVSLSGFENRVWELCPWLTDRMSVVTSEKARTALSCYLRPQSGLMEGVTYCPWTLETSHFRKESLTVLHRMVADMASSVFLRLWLCLKVLLT